MAQEVVIIVHGTFASTATWWRRGRDFATKLEQALAALGLDTTCWAGTLREFMWSGTNSDLAREEGARQLAEYVKKVVDECNPIRVHFVCHSHGGNVFLRAIGHLPRRCAVPVINGTKVFLGTPFYHYVRWRNNDDNVRKLEFHLIVMFLVLATMVYFSIGGFLYFLVGLSAVLHTVWFFSLPFRVGPSQPSGLKQGMFKDRNVIYSFGADEALLALQAAVEYWQFPVIKGLAFPAAKWRGKLAAQYPGLYINYVRYFSRYYRSVEVSDDAKFRLLPYLREEFGVFKQIPQEARDSGWVGACVPIILLTLAWPIAYPLVLLRWLVLVVIDAGLLGGVVRLSPYLQRMAIRRGLRAAARAALGMDRFRQTVSSVRRTPDDHLIDWGYRYHGRHEGDLWLPAEIPKTVEKAVNDVAIRHASTTIAKAYAVPDAQKNRLRLRMDQVARIFSGHRYVHNQYYEQDWIVQDIARRIAANRHANDLEEYIRDEIE
jgi:hypothetical protein